MANLDLKSHWDKTYSRNAVDTLGWYEEHPQPSLDLIQKCNLKPDARILNIGAGASILIDKLIDLNYQNILVNDICSVALDKLKQRLETKSNTIIPILDDVTKSNYLTDIEPVNLWHDRAVLHFFNTDSEQDAYFNLLKKLVKKGGYVIIASFNLQGADKCSGLPIFKYNTQMLTEKLGSDFTLIDDFDYVYTMPSGNTRNYVYTLFRHTA